MTQRSDIKGEPRPEADGAIDPEMRDPWYQDWMAEHVTDLKRHVEGQRILYGWLAFAFVLGIGFQVVGYAIKFSGPQEALGLVADLVYALGWALWTGVVVVLFVEVVPEVKRRQIKRAVDDYEAFVQQSRAGRDQTSAGNEHRE